MWDRRRTIQKLGLDALVRWLFSCSGFASGQADLICFATYDLHQSTIDLVFFVVGVGLGFRISGISELAKLIISPKEEKGFKPEADIDKIIQGVSFLNSVPQV